MKKRIVAIMVLSLIITKAYSQINLDSVYSNLNAKVLRLEDSINKLKQDETSLYSLKRNMLLLQKQNEESHKEWWSDFFKFYGVIGFVIGGFIGFWGLKNQTKKMVIEKIADVTGINQKELKVILENKLTNKQLRVQKSFIILNEENSVFTFGFKQVMKLFGVDASKNKYLTNINGLNSIDDKLISRIKKYDVLIIENQSSIDNSRWEFPKFYGDYEKLKEEIANLENEENTDISELLKLKNYERLVFLSNKICDTTSIIYYGQAGAGNFPSDLVNQNLQHKITFANAPAQLYGNINNQLQFIYELEKES